jgi:TPR repeat protein
MKSERALLSAAVRQRFPCVEPSWRQYIYGAVYIPSAAERHLVTLKRDGRRAFLDELEKLAALGSPWASAFLGYQALLLTPDGTRNIERAIQLCKQPALSGDAYAAYILGWATFLSGDHAEALTYFRRATRQLFPPAVLDSVQFFWSSKGRTEPAGVLISLRQARNVGHRCTMVFRGAIYRTGKLGIGRLLLGFLLWPVAWLYFSVASFRDPFSAQSFVFDSRNTSRVLGLRE